MKKNKSIFIHVGMAKTGTTSIQNFLTINQGELLKRDLYYPRIGRPYNVASDTMTNGHILVRDDRLSALRNVISNFMKLDCGRMLLSEETLTSSENRFNLYDEEVCNILKAFDLKIIIYFRRSYDFLTSLWQERLKHKSLSTDIVTFIRNYDHESFFIKFKELQKSFGRENIIVKTFEKERWVDNNIVDDFLSIFNIDNSSEFKSISLSNQGLDRETADVLRYINEKLPDNPQELKNELLRLGTSCGSSQKIADSVEDEEVKFVCDKYYPYEHEIAKEYFNRDELFLDKYPKFYGAQRDTYKGLDKDFMDEIRFSIDLFMKRKIISTQQSLVKALEGGNGTCYAHGKAKVFVEIKKVFVKLLCAFIPFKKNREAVRIFFAAQT